MERYPKILVTTDFSDTSTVGVRAAARLARAWEARVQLVHAVMPERYARDMFPGTEPTLMERMHEAARGELDRLGKEHFEGVEVDVASTEGDSSAMALVEHADESGASLMVVTTHGRTGLSRMLIGSIAETILRHAPCDVLCVRPETPLESFPPRRVVAPTDLSDLAARGLVAAGEVARASGAKVSLVHVIDANKPAVPAAAFKEDGELRQRRMRELEDQRATHLTGLDDVETEVFSDVSPPDAVCRHAATQDADLLVVATHGRSGIARLLIGSVAERIVRHAPCPVLVVRASD